MTQIGTNHVLNTNLQAELPIICLYHFLGPYFIFFLLFVWLILPFLQDLFPMVSLITYMDFIFEHSPASFSLLFYCYLEISYQFTLLYVIMLISPTSCNLPGTRVPSNSMYAFAHLLVLIPRLCLVHNGC